MKLEELAGPMKFPKFGSLTYLKILMISGGTNTVFVFQRVYIAGAVVVAIFSDE